MKEFNVQITNLDEVKTGKVEDYFTMGQILELYGQRVQDFKNVDEALAATRHLCAKNAEDYGYEEKPEAIDEKFPQFSKFWFVKSTGKETTNSSVTQKQLGQTGDLKSVSQLNEAMVFMEGVGFDAPSLHDDAAAGKIANVKHEGLIKQVELLKMPYLF